MNESKRGWITLNRQITNHWVWDCEFSTGQAWVDLLLNANHTVSKFMIKGQLIQLERGQQARSEITLASTWKWSRGKVRRFLKNLENDGMIEQKAGHLTSIITICNYDVFQHHRTADGTTDGQQTEQHGVQQTDIWQDTNNNGKTVDTAKTGKTKIQQVDFSCLQMTDFEVGEVKRIRKANKGGQITQRVVDGLAIQFSQAVAMGYSIDEVLTWWECGGWKSFKAEWLKQKTLNGEFSQVTQKNIKNISGGW